MSDRVYQMKVYRKKIHWEWLSNSIIIGKLSHYTLRVFTDNSKNRNRRTDATMGTGKTGMLPVTSLLLGILFFFAAPCGAQRCPEACACAAFDGEMNVDCPPDPNRIDLPANIPCRARNFILSNGAVTNVRNHSFSCHRELVLLDLKNNLIAFIEEGSFANLSALSTLNLRGNKLSSLPVMHSLISLREVRLSHNLFRHCPFELPLHNSYSAVELEWNPLLEPIVVPYVVKFIKLKGNSLSALQSSTFIHGHLIEILDFSLNDLTSLDILDIVNVTRLNVGFNRIRILDSSAFSKLQKLKYLDLQANNIKTISSIMNLSSLEVIDLMNNAIATIDESALSGLPRLHTLILRGNKLTKVFHASLPELRYIILNDNMFSMSVELHQWPQVHLINVEGNNLSKFILRDVGQLNTIFADNNVIESVNFPNSGSLVKLRCIFLARNRLRSVHNIQNFPEMTYINLRMNLISSWGTPGLSNMTQLLRLQLQTNLIQELVNLPELPALDTLDLSDNRIHWIREGALHFPSLETLYLNGNRLNVFPWLRKTPLLHTLILKTNYINDIDLDEIDLYLSLQHLSLQGNGLCKIPRFLSNRILSLSLAKNNISNTELDELLARYTTLNALDISDNKLHDPLPIFPFDLVTLNLSANELTLSSSDAPYPFPSELKVLYLARNKISALGYNVQFGAELKNLDLSYNAISLVQSGFFFSTRYLTTLDLGHNMLCSVDVGTFRYLSSVNFIMLEWNQLRYLPNETFSACSRLYRLDLTGNPLTRISILAFRGLTNLANLLISHMDLIVLDISVLLDMPALGIVKMHNNSIVNIWSKNSAIPTDQTKASLVTLSGNELSANFPRFRSRHIILIDLSENHFTRVPLQVRETSDYSFLQTLMLSKNKIRVINSDDFSRLAKLSILTLDHNDITSIGLGSFSFSNSLSTLDLVGNGLKFLDIDSLPMSSRLLRFDPGGNPWHCDCSMRPFREWLPFASLSAAVCASPAAVRNQSLTDIALVDGKCRNNHSVDSERMCASPNKVLIAYSDDRDLVLPCPINVADYSQIVWSIPGGKRLDLKHYPSVNHTMVESDGRIVLHQLAENRSGLYSCSVPGTTAQIVFSFVLLIVANNTIGFGGPSARGFRTLALARKWASGVVCAGPVENPSGFLPTPPIIVMIVFSAIFTFVILMISIVWLMVACRSKKHEIISQRKQGASVERRREIEVTPPVAINLDVRHPPSKGLMIGGADSVDALPISNTDGVDREEHTA